MKQWTWNVDTMFGELERGTKIASATLGPIISETTLVQLGWDEREDLILYEAFSDVKGVLEKNATIFMYVFMEEIPAIHSWEN